MEYFKKYNFLFFSFLILLVTNANHLNADQKHSEITIDFRSQSPINRLILGHNALSHDSCTYSRNPTCVNDGKYSNFGSGQWNPEKASLDQSFLQFSKQINLNFLRFPGGCGTHLYNWKEAIGPPDKRPMFQFGIDEFLLLCDTLNIEPIITLSYFTGSNQDLADLVEYLNYPLHSGNPNGGENWAEIRARNGHPAPYQVRYFELGNEIYHGEHTDTVTPPPTPEDYAQRYIACQLMMKQIDAKIELGAVLQGWHFGATPWDTKVATLLSDTIDFGIIHVYPINYQSDSNRYSAKQIFSVALASPIQAEYGINSFSRQLKELTKRDIPLAITEYNGHFVQKLPIPYRHSLGNALLVADLLRVFLTVDAPILGANYWQLANSYWGLLYNHSFQEKKGTYTKRPNYFVFELYSRHFGNLLLKTYVDGPEYTSRAFGGVMATGVTAKNTIRNRQPVPLKISIRPVDWEIKKTKQLSSSPLSVQTSRNENVYILSFSEAKDMSYRHTEHNQTIDPDRKYRLTGKIKTENFSTAPSVYLEVQDSRELKKSFWKRLTHNISESNGWKNVMVKFQSLHDTNKVKIIIRCQFAGKNLTGKVLIKDVMLEDIGPAIRFPGTPYLSAVSSTNQSGNKINIIVINKNFEEFMRAKIEIKNGFDIAQESKYWLLNGPDIASTNEKMQEHVKITEGALTITPHDNSFFYSFSPHSVTVLELHKKKFPDNQQPYVRTH